MSLWADTTWSQGSLWINPKEALSWSGRPYTDFTKALLNEWFKQLAAHHLAFIDKVDGERILIYLQDIQVAIEQCKADRRREALVAAKRR
jgi:hypothetical protein